MENYWKWIQRIVWLTAIISFLKSWEWKNMKDVGNYIEKFLVNISPWQFLFLLCLTVILCQLIVWLFNIHKTYKNYQIFRDETLNSLKMLQKHFRSDGQLRILLINSAQYGAQGKIKDVADILRSRITSGRIDNFSVRNASLLGSDPDAYSGASRHLIPVESAT